VFPRAFQSVQYGQNPLEKRAETHPCSSLVLRRIRHKAQCQIGLGVKVYSKDSVLLILRGKKEMKIPSFSTAGMPQPQNGKRERCNKSHTNRAIVFFGPRRPASIEKPPCRESAQKPFSASPHSHLQVKPIYNRKSLACQGIEAAIAKT